MRELKSNEVQEVSLGFEEVHEGLKVRSYIDRLKAEIRVSGLLSNFWLANIVLIQTFFAAVCAYIIYKYYRFIPAFIGLNFDDMKRLDTPINRSYVYFILFIHVIVPCITVLFAMRDQKKITHLMTLSFLYYLVLGVFELIALRNLIVYFM